jgi:ligand-binding sensor domain-containing protein/serine phosphatase RsbU (regulator of sigma subunit)
MPLNVGFVNLSRFAFLLGVLWTFCALLHAKAQDTQAYVKFDRISADAGLSQNAVQAVVQDFRGFMWFGTQNGLNRYDGYDFKVFTQNGADSTSLSGNYVQALLEDQQRQLWVSAGGLHRYDRENMRFEAFTHRPGDPQSIASNVIHCLYEDKLGNLWIGTNNGLSMLPVEYITAKTPKFKTFRAQAYNPKALSHNNVLSIFEDSHGTLWVGTENGLNRMLPDFSGFTPFFAEKEKPGSLCHNTIRAMAEDPQGNLWIGTPEGLSILQAQHRNEGYFNACLSTGEKLLPSADIRTLHKDKDGWLWVGTSEGLARLLRQEEEKFYFETYQHDPLNPTSLSDNHILCIGEDKDGILWVGTFLGGVNKYDKHKEKFFTHRKRPNTQSTLSDNIVRAFYEDGKTLWVGTYYGGLNRIEKSSESTEITHIRKRDGLPSDNITALLKDNESQLWIGTENGLAIRQNSGRIKVLQEGTALSHRHVHGLFQDSRRQVWVSTLRGLDVYDPKTESFTYFVAQPEAKNAYQGAEVWGFAEATSGHIWLASAHGLHVFDPEKQSFTAYFHTPGDPTTLPNNHTRCVVQGPEGKIWVGTDGSGLAFLDPKTGAFRQFTERDGLANNVVYGLLFDGQGRLWASTNKGLSRFEPETENFRNYDITDGLQSNEFNAGAYHKGESGKFYFGGISGYNGFFPEEIIDNPSKPRLVVTDFRLGNKSILPKESDILEKNITETTHIHLTYEQNNIAFEFAALQYSFPKKNLYAYRLEGFDKDWIYTSAERRFISYTNLNPGQYSFQVRGANSDGSWNNDALILEINIAPPFWKEWWFIAILSTAAFVGLIFLLSSIRFHNVKQYIERAVEARTHELRKQKERAMQERDSYESSIKYAKKIHDAILHAPEELIQKLPDAFILERPSQIVSGDFFWLHEDSEQEKLFIAAVDCTGHGVPGAFMSLVSHNALNQVVSQMQIQDPAEILTQLDLLLQKALRRGTIEDNDYITLSLVVLDQRNHILEFAGAKMHMALMQGGKLHVVRGNRRPLGGHWDGKDEKREFTVRTFSTEMPTTCYLYTDGYYNQFGGPEGKKFMHKNLLGLFRKIYTSPAQEQRQVLSQTLKDWTGKQELLDDVLILGFSV